MAMGGAGDVTEAGSQAGHETAQQSKEIDPAGPFLTAALLCERVLVEKDDTISVIRVIERLVYTVDSGSPPPSPSIATFTFTALLAFKAGARLGPTAVRIDQISPSGQRLPGLLFDFVLGKDGVNLISEILMTTGEPGNYWFEILLDGHAVTRVPLEIVLRPSADSSEATP